MIDDAKKALAGLEVMTAILEIVNARRPDLIEQAAEKVLGVKTDIGDAEFNAILDKRAEAITHFDKYPDRVTENALAGVQAAFVISEKRVADLESELRRIKRYAEHGAERLEIVQCCDAVLK